METIKKERVHKEFYEIYVANDGTEFNDKEECKKYEESAHCVLFTKYNKLVVESKDEWSFFGFGSDESMYDAVRVPDNDAADLILQIDALCNPQYYKKDACENYVKWRNEHIEQVRRAQNEGDLLFIGRGWEGNQNDFYIYHTRNAYIDVLNNIGKVSK